MNDVTEKKVKKIQLNRKKKFILLSSSLLITLLVLIIAILCFINYKNNVKKYKTMSLYQYFNGVKYEYTGEVTLTLKDGIIDLKNEDSSKKINFDSLPVYVKGSEHKMILPKTMSVVIPSIKNKNYKISKLTMVKTDFELDNQSYLLYEYDNMYLDKSFLYDGVDTYVFLDNVELVVDDKKINLYKITRIAGTVIDKDKNKSSVMLLTTNGVVTVKVWKNQYAIWDRQIAKKNPDGTKTVVEKSFFERGNKLIITGVRREDNFIPKKYKNTEFPLFEKIISLDEKGFILESQTERTEVD